jgi:hypothetical protein
METDMDVKTAIRRGDADTIRLLLAEDVSYAKCADSPGKERVRPHASAPLCLRHAIRGHTGMTAD